MLSLYLGGVVATCVAVLVRIWRHAEVDDGVDVLIALGVALGFSAVWPVTVPLLLGVQLRSWVALRQAQHTERRRA